MRPIVVVLAGLSLPIACAKSDAPPQAEPAPAAAPAAEPEASPPQPSAATAAEPTGDFDAAELVGAWQYTTSEHTVNGPCPASPVTQGELQLDQAGEAMSFVFVSGQTCKPEETCAFAGDLEGGVLRLSNETTVDDEGGKVVNEAELTLTSPKAGTGTVTSTYTHPGGMQCRWTYQLALSR